jgi:hypothetical protein
MTITAKLTSPNHGYDSDKEQVKKLDPDCYYVVSNVSIGSYSSSFGLVEFPGQSFNTVQFDFYEDDRLIDVLNRFYDPPGNDYY